MKVRADVDKLRATSTSNPLEEPSEDIRIRLQQVRTITAAYKSLLPSEPTLPSPESPLPALLALRSTLNLIEQSKGTIRATGAQLVKAHASLHRENRNLDDARYLTSGLESRIHKLRNEKEELSRQTLQEIAKVLMTEQQQRNIHYSKELRALVRGFNRFVHEYLAVMLAAEDLGGPVVGDDLDLDDAALRAGFTPQGKLQRPSVGSSKDEEKRRRRNEDIWGEYADSTNGQSGTERQAAAASFRGLTESLLNAAADDESHDAYIKVAKESAAVRFLVRARVAEMDPDDARRLRLLDFGADMGP